MKPSSPFATRIAGTGSHFPARRLSNHDLAKTIDTNDEWIRERTGILERRISEPGNPAEQNSSLAFQAALMALKAAGKKPEDIDQILYATCTPDTPIPSSACWLQSKLGAKNAWAVDLNAACSGFIYAMAMADQAIQCGQVKTSLVIGSEVLSSYTNWEDRTSCILFGDGAGAMVLERTESSNPRRILSTHLGSDGTLWDLFTVEAGGSNQNVTPEKHAARADKMQMKGKEIYKHAVRTLTEYAVKALEANQMTTADLDWVIPHQANLRIIEAVAKRLEIPMSKVLVNIDRYGNTSSATVPSALDEAIRDGRVKPGQTVLLDVFGAGLTYGSVLARV